MQIHDWRNVPYKKVYAERLDRLEAISSSDKVLRAHHIHYKANAVDFINDWMMTYDPRRKPTYLPFLLFPRQVEFVHWVLKLYHEQKDGLVEKSRDMGLTWLCMAVSIYLWTFHEGSKIAFGSHKQDKIDKLGDPDSIFEKGRMILNALPEVFLPRGFRPDKHMPFLKIINPANGATITGESGDQIGRGGRSSIYWKDESAFYERPLKIEASLSQTSNVKIDISTPNGPGNPFYRKRFSGKISVFVYDWRDDPRKDDKWYKRQVELLDPIVVAQEIDRDYSASAENLCISNKWIEASRKLTVKLGHHYGKFRTVVGGLDVGGGRAKSVWVARRGPFILPSVSWKEKDTTNTAHRALDLAKEAKVKYFNYDNVSLGQGVESILNKQDKITCYGVNVGVPASNDYWPDGKRAREKFANLKAELWWKVRDRLVRTYEHWLFLEGDSEGIEYELDELLLLPEDPDICSQLSVPKIFRNEKGKQIMESKQQLSIRGIPSPDFAEAVILTEADPGIAAAVQPLEGW